MAQEKNKYHIGKNGGIATTRLYNIWLHMKGRCERKSDDHYKWYGKRGIKVCEEWHDFRTFREWSMQNGYSDKLTIDRIDNEKDYSPENCRWINHKQQCNNRRSNVILTINGQSHNIQEWAQITGVKYATIYQRYKSGKTENDLIKVVI